MFVTTILFVDSVLSGVAEEPTTIRSRVGVVVGEAVCENTVNAENTNIFNPIRTFNFIIFFELRLLAKILAGKSQTKFTEALSVYIKIRLKHKRLSNLQGNIYTFHKFFL